MLRRRVVRRTAGALALAAALLGSQDARAEQTVAAQADAAHSGFVSGAQLGRPGLTEAWRFQRTGVTFTGSPITAGGSVFVVSRTTNQSAATVRALDLATGAQRWERDVTSAASLAWDAGRLFVQAAGSLIALDGDSGRQLWTRQVSTYATPVAAEGRVLANATDSATLVAYDGATGALQWSRPRPVTSYPTVAGGLAIGQTSCGVQSVRAADGADALSLPVDCASGSSSSYYAYGGPTASDGARVLSWDSNATGRLGDLADGSVSQRMPLTGAPALAGDTLLLRDGSQLKARSMATGLTTWSAAGDGFLSGAPLVVDGVVYAGSTKGRVVAFDLGTGAELWRSDVVSTSTDYYAALTPDLAVADGTLVLRGSSAVVGLRAADSGASRLGAGFAVASGPRGITTSPDAAFTTTAVPAGSRVDCRLDGGGWATCPGAAAYTGLAEGPHAFEVRLVDALGVVQGQASRAFSVDRTAPELTLGTAPVDGSVVATTSASVSGASVGGAPPECRFDQDAWTPCSGERSFSSYRYGLAQGAHSFEARVSDPAGNQRQVSRRWTVDTVAPVVDVRDRPDGLSGSTESSVTFTGGDAVSFRCALDQAPAVACSSPWRILGLSAGYHSVSITAVDAAGNTGYGSFSWTIDPPGPDTTFTATPPETSVSRTATLAFTAPDADRFECRLDVDPSPYYAASGWAACTSPRSVGPLRSGRHRYDVRALSTKGAKGDVQSWSWTVAPPPARAEVTSAPAARTALRDAEVTWTGQDGAERFACALDGAQERACATPWTAEQLPVGDHELAIRAIDVVEEGDVIGVRWRIESADAVTPPATTDAGPTTPPPGTTTPTSTTPPATSTTPTSTTPPATSTTTTPSPGTAAPGSTGTPDWLVAWPGSVPVQPGPVGAPATAPSGDRTGPQVSAGSLLRTGRLGSAAAKRKLGRTRLLRVRLGEAAQLTVGLQRCRSTAGPCLVMGSPLVFSRPAAAGTSDVTVAQVLGRRSLAKGRYLVAVLATDAAGNVTTVSPGTLLVRPR